MSQLATSDGQPGNWEEPDIFVRGLEPGFRVPCQPSTLPVGTGGEIPPVYPAFK
jgi:hypothetical protein